MRKDIQKLKNTLLTSKDKDTSYSAKDLATSKRSKLQALLIRLFRLVRRISKSDYWLYHVNLSVCPSA